MTSSNIREAGWEKHSALSQKRRWFLARLWQWRKWRLALSKPQSFEQFLWMCVAVQRTWSGKSCAFWRLFQVVSLWCLRSVHLGFFLRFLKEGLHFGAWQTQLGQFLKSISQLTLQFDVPQTKSQRVQKSPSVNAGDFRQSRQWQWSHVSRRSASLKTDRCNGQHIDFRTRMAEGVFMNFNRFPSLFLPLKQVWECFEIFESEVTLKSLMWFHDCKCFPPGQIALLWSEVVTPECATQNDSSKGHSKDV